MRRYVAVPLLITAVMVLMAVSAQTCFAHGAVIRVTSSKGIDRAVRLAKKKGHGTTVYFRAGSYSHRSMTWPSGINLRGAGIGRTKLNFAITFGSRSLIGGHRQSAGLTVGSTGADTTFSLKDGAHNTSFWCVRFRSRGATLWDLCDFTRRWHDGVVRDHANVHDIAWVHCEFEYTGDSNGTTFNVWWDARKGGGNLYNLTWKGCTFGVKNASGQDGSGRIGLLIQPSPPEHAADGPRPGSASSCPNFGFNLSQITHGSGQAAIGGAHGYGFRIWNSAFVGSSSFNSFDLCDYVRAWAMVAHRLTQSGQVTRAMVAAAPARFTTKGVSLRHVWMAGDFTREFGRNVKTYRVRANQGSAYHVPAAVRSHDRQLYGF